MHLRGKLKGNRVLSCAVVLTVLAGLILGQGCTREADLKVETAYQAVALDNGQVFIGKLEQGGSAYPLLREVFYIQRLTEGDIVIWHGHLWGGRFQMSGVGERQVTCKNGRGPSGQKRWITSGYGSFLAQ